LGAEELTFFSHQLTLEGITTLNAAELARTSSESLCAISESLTAQKSGVPISEDVIFAISPGTFADKRDRVSTDLTYVRAVCSSDVQWVVLGNNPIHNAVTQRTSVSQEATASGRLIYSLKD
jgi:hypothetical protein